MKLSWLFNGTMEAHHLAAAYLVVWVVQGGYAAWIAVRWYRLKKHLHTEPMTQSSSHPKEA